MVVLFNVLRERVEAGLDDVPPGSLQEPLGAYGGKANRARMIPVVSWAHAGRAETYEELPSDWREQIPTECRDEAAFAVSLEGDSMEPVFRSGDLLVVMPSEEVYSGAYAVCRFRDDGVVLRQVEFSGGEVQLVPLNPRFEVRTFPKEQFAWIYPVWGRWSQFWKR
ncbi:MAG: S24 family peptidase [Verrucomicrobiota bacterium]